MRRTAAACILATTLLAPSAHPHPHVFVGGGAHFGMDAEGKVERLYISWIYDTFASLYLLSFLQADADGDQKLTEEEKERILADQTMWPDTFAGDSYLWASGGKVALGKPVNADTRILEDGRVEVTFERILAEPVRPSTSSETVTVKLYDPTFYYAYEVSEEPEVRGPEGHGCSTRHVPYDPNLPGLAALQVELSALGRDETPEQEDVGALFADELILTCE